MVGYEDVNVAGREVQDLMASSTMELIYTTRMTCHHTVHTLLQWERNGPRSNNNII